MKKINLIIPYKELKEKHKQIRDQQTVQNSTRIHRAISWLKNVDQIEELDLIFIQLWISFNAAYAGNFDDKQNERVKLNAFLTKIVALDTDKNINKVIFTKFSGSIRPLIDNKFAFERFWQAMRNHDSSDSWKNQFASEKKKSVTVMMMGDSATILAIIFSRVYTIRNQIIHGGATFSSRVNREQLKDACQILADIIPLTIQIMINNPNYDFGEIAYPVVA